MELLTSKSPKANHDKELHRSDREEKETPLWDSFLNPPGKMRTRSADWARSELYLKLFKLFVCVFVFIIVLAAATISKITYVFMVSQLSGGSRNDRDHLNRNTDVENEDSIDEHIAWFWVIICAFGAPELLTLLRATRYCIFKGVKAPPAKEIISVAFFDLMHVIGLAFFTFKVLVKSNVGRGLLLNCGICFIPAFFNILKKISMDCKSIVSLCVNILALVAQASAFIVCLTSEHWPIEIRLTFIPLILISFRWWENYVNSCSNRDSPTRSIRQIRSRYRIYLYLSPVKVIVFSLMAFFLDGQELSVYFSRFSNGWTTHEITVQKIVMNATNSSSFPVTESSRIKSSPTFLISTLCLQILASYLCFVFGKFACKIKIQHFSFALPLSLSSPLTLAILLLLSSLYESDKSFFANYVSNYVEIKLNGFLKCSTTEIRNDLKLWILLWLSQVWTTSHIWNQQSDSNSSTEKLFVCPGYCGLLIDQCLIMNRRIIRNKSKKNDGSAFGLSQPVEITSGLDAIPQLIVCATMWHETQEEMMEFLKSVMRLDEDQCARRMARTYINSGRTDQDYYELEINVFFDDAFILDEINSKNYRNPPLNEYVRNLITNINKAAFEVHDRDMKIKPPVKMITPYGGRLVWTLPGRTQLVVHLKNKDKIRHKKRWSQVMYMYYMLGFRIMEPDNISIKRKAIVAENTFLLALDGDIEFQPQAVQMLMDRMKTVEELGAVCGRIHPVGKGPMVWYQKFEYAIGHWLQKATEHVIGCVLCSPGCFSLFRGSALMENSVMRKYTTESEKPMHYIQYDQGEDRWLCTLLLKQGMRVEYSAAADAYTHSPEVFHEFYNQRRRWVPSTIANIFDLLSDSKDIVKRNNSISMLFMAYQSMLMAGTILGPGTIFLMTLGALMTVFDLDIWLSFVWNFFPVIIFIVSCIFLKQKYQILLAFLISSLYCFVMIAVLIGIIIQIMEDGPLAPSSLFFILVFSQILVAGLLHPQEISALACGIIYYVTIPSMYMLLIIYSVLNMNDVSWGTREVREKATDHPSSTDAEKGNEHNFPGWMNDPLLADSDLSEITISEKRFWKDLIRLYLKPIFHTKEKKAEIKKDLTELRNIFSFSFIMINAILVLSVFLLQLKKEYLHLDWPIDPHDYILFDDTNSQIYIYRHYKELDPIGLCFVLFFGLILIIQFIAMLFHRFATISHILAMTRLEWFRSTNSITDEDAVHEIRGNAVNIARQLQRPVLIGKTENIKHARRQTVYQLHHFSNHQARGEYSDLPTNFVRRFLSEDNMQLKDISMSRKSIMLLNETRQRAKQRITENVQRTCEESFEENRRGACANRAFEPTDC